MRLGKLTATSHASASDLPTQKINNMKTPATNPHAALRHHVTGAVERGESTAIAGIPAVGQAAHTPIEAAIADSQKPNWTGLNAIQLYDIGRLVDSSLKQWAIDCANERIGETFNVSIMNKVDTDRAIEYFDAYVEGFIKTVKQSALAAAKQA